MIKGLIFDFDGLMVDTESPAYDSWVEIYREHNCELPLIAWAAVLGGSGTEFDPCRYLEEQVGRTLDSEALRTRRWQRKLELTAVQPLLPGIMTYIDQAKILGLKVGVASSSSRKWVVGHLDRLQVTSRCDAIICSDDVTHVKPDPEIYTAALAALALNPEEALAFEDAPNGMVAAHRAGIVCVAVPNPLTGQLPLEHADVRLSSLAEQPLRAVLAQVQPWLDQGQWGARPRVSATVLRDGGQEVLMVKHRQSNGREYWQLPGGGISPSESAERAVLRELHEETKLTGHISRVLFTIPYKYGSSTTFLVEVDPAAQAAVGIDPEEMHAEHRKLVAVAWLPVADVRDNPEIRHVQRCLS